MTQKSILFLIFITVQTTLNAQGFELIFGDTIIPETVFEIPGQNAYFVAGELSGMEVKLAKITENGNLIWFKSLPTIANFAYIKSSFAVEPDGIVWTYVFSTYDTLGYVRKRFDFDLNLVNEIVQTQELVYDAALRATTFLPDYSAVLWLEQFGTNKYQLIKYSPDGVITWNKTFSESPEIVILNEPTLTASNSSEIYLAGSTPIPNGFPNNPALIKFSPNGEHLWTTVVDSIKTQVVYLQLFPDQERVLLYGDDQSSFLFGTFFGVIDKNGQQENMVTFTDHLEFVRKKGVIPGENNTFYVTGIREEALTQEVLLQIDQNVSVIWENSYAKHKYSYEGQVIRDHDGGFIIAAETFPDESQTVSTDPYIIKTDAQGNKVWDWSGGQDDLYLHSDALITSGNEYLILGTSRDNVNFNYRGQLLKLSPNGTLYANHITGNLFFDQNQSCFEEAPEPGLAGWKIKSNASQTVYAVTDAFGNFTIECNGDSAVLTALPPAPYWTFCSPAQTVYFNTGGDTVSAEIQAQALVECPGLSVNMSTPFLRRCFDNNYFINVCNQGTVPAAGVELTVSLDSFFVFNNAVPAAQSVDGQEVNFLIGNLDIGECRLIKINFGISCEAAFGQEHCITAMLTAQNTCENVFISDRECQPNIGSFDPNDKRAFADGRPVESIILPDSLLEYQIRFQNTGTDTAFTVVIRDTLSANLDLATVQSTVASHNFRWHIEKSNILVVTFDNIMLPDSNINEPASHGFFNFTVWPKAGLPLGTPIFNTAAIYFDFNDPVITNVVALEVNLLSGTADPGMETVLIVYPSPSSGKIRIDAGALYKKVSEITVTNAIGYVVMRQIPSVGAGNMFDLDLTPLANGVYFIRTTVRDCSTATGRVVIMH